MERKQPVSLNFIPAKFKVLYRFLVKAAMDKRCVPYYEVQELLGVSWQSVGIYAGRIGDYCIANDLPLLNALIISTTECKPSGGFDWYEKQRGESWGDLLSESWKHFHVPSSRLIEANNFSGLEPDLDAFIAGLTR